MAAKNPDRSVSTIPIREWDQWMADHPDIQIRLPDGTSINIPPPERWSDDAMEYVEEHPERPIGLSKLILTTDQRKKVLASGANSGYVFDQIAKLTGLDEGKSSASSGS